MVEQFKADPVAIVNIAVDSDSGRWKEMVKKHQLKTLNLLAQDKWNDVLSEKFGIQGLPHSVLIDWNGKIVQNKCARASEQVDEQIAALLDEVEVESY